MKIYFKDLIHYKIFTPTQRPMAWTLHWKMTDIMTDIIVMVRRNVTVHYKGHRTIDQYAVPNQ